MGRYPLEVFWSDEDRGFIAEVPDLPGCSAFGADEAEAVREAQDAIAAWIEAAKAAKREVPEPSKVEPLTAYSGKFLVRIGRELHQRLTRDAQNDGLSLNQYVLKVLSGSPRTQAKSSERAPKMLVAHKALGATSHKVAQRGTARKSASKRANKK